MRLNQDCLTRCLRSLACPEVAEAVVVAVATVEVAEIVAETAETVVAAVQQTPSQLKMVKAERGVAHVIRMGLQIGPAGSTGNGGSRVTFV